jgi:hypothetical protein
MVLQSDTSGAEEARRVEKYQRDVLTVCPQLLPVPNLTTLFLGNPRTEVGRKVDILDARFNELWKETPPELADKAKAADAAAADYVAAWRTVLTESSFEIGSVRRTTSTLDVLEGKLTSLAGAECKSADSNDFLDSILGGPLGGSKPTSKPSG